MNFTELSEQLKTAAGVLEFCQDRRLLARTNTCPSCGYKLRSYCKKQNKRWLYLKCQAGKCRTFTSIRTGTFFTKSRLAIANTKTDLFVGVRESNAKRTPTRMWNSFDAHHHRLLNICGEYFLRNSLADRGPKPYGGGRRGFV